MLVIESIENHVLGLSSPIEVRYFTFNDPPLLHRVRHKKLALGHANWPASWLQENDKLAQLNKIKNIK
jgi:hypothetical protein